MEHHRKSATQLLALLEAGELSAVSVVTAFLDRIAAVEPRLHAYLHVRDRKALLAEAEAIDERRRRGERVGKLAGLPIAVKDNIATAGIPTTCASRILANFVPPFDATVIRRLRAEGAIILGKTNLDEFAMGSSTENSAFSKTRNPWNPDFVPGGSSGGSAVAVAVDAAAVALGSDTGGSVRQPAAFCGVYGLKPTYGTVSRFGLVAFGSSLDQIGVLGDTVEDCARIFEVIEGHDPNDSTSLPHDPPSVAWKRERKRPQILGWPREYFGEGIDPEVRTALEAARERFADLGYPIETISLPHTPYAIATYYIIAAAEASSNLARYDGVRYGYRSANAGDISRLYLRSRSEGFGSEVKRRIMLGTFVLSSGYYEEYYDRAQQVRTAIRNDFSEAFRHCDAILAPVSPFPPFRIGEKVEDPLQMYLADVFTATVNLAGLPAISVPCGFSSAGLPIGMQLIGPAFRESSLLGIAHDFEQTTDFSQRKPPL